MQKASSFLFFFSTLPFLSAFELLALKLVYGRSGQRYLQVTISEVKTSSTNNIAFKNYLFADTILKEERDPWSTYLMLKKQVVKKTLMVNKQTWIRNAFCVRIGKKISQALEIILNGPQLCCNNVLCVLAYLCPSWNVFVCPVTKRWSKSCKKK